MKSRLIVLLSLTLMVFPLILNSQTIGIKDFDKKFNIILLKLDSVINNSGIENELVQKHFNYINNKILSKELPVTYDSTLTYDLFASSAFKISNHNHQDISLSYGKFLVDKYDQFPCLVYAIIINSFQYAYDYYTKQEQFLISLSNNIKKLYFEIDAMTLETLFLKAYCENNENLGYLERYLVSDLENGLAGSSILFKRTDLILLHKMDGLKSKNSSSRRLLKEFREIGNELIKDISFENKSAWENYCSFVSLRTYVFYSQQVIFDIVHLKDNILMDDFKLENYPANLSVINEIRKITSERIDDFKYHEETMKIFIEYYN